MFQFPPQVFQLLQQPRRLTMGRPLSLERPDLEPDLSLPLCPGHTQSFFRLRLRRLAFRSAASFRACSSP